MARRASGSMSLACKASSTRPGPWPGNAQFKKLGFQKKLCPIGHVFCGISKSGILECQDLDKLFGVVIKLNLVAQWHDFLQPSQRLGVTAFDICFGNSVTTASDPMKNAFLCYVDRRQIDKIQLDFKAESLGLENVPNCGLST